MANESDETRSPRVLTRRTLLHRIGTGLVVAPMAHLFACSSEGEGDDELGDGGSESTDETSGSGSESETGDETSGSGSEDTTDSDSTDTDSTDTGSGCEEASEWASGGTAAMTKKECYPDPFAGVASCMLLCQTTEGPCTADTLERQDVSEGWSGLPVRLSLKIVDKDTCEPVEGVQLEIWHTQRTGVYSGVTPSGAFCYGNDPDAENYLYFRGMQTTDAQGRVDFDTCFPGWYSGRCIHIHFRVWTGASDYVISQLVFDDALVEEIFATHPEYVEFGQPNTWNTNDNIVGGVDDLSPYVLDIQRMADGAMLASKVIAIRSSTADQICSIGGGGGPPP